MAKKYTFNMAVGRDNILISIIRDGDECSATIGTFNTMEEAIDLCMLHKEVICNLLNGKS